MTETVGVVPPVAPPFIPSATPAPPAIELAQAPPTAVMLASTLSATVVGRGGNGALLLRTDYGTLALKTTLDLPPGSRVDLKLQPGPPVTVVLLNLAESDAAATAAAGATLSTVAAAGGGTAAAPSAGSATAPTSPAQLVVGTEVEATLVSLPINDPTAVAFAVGTRLVLRIALASPDEPPAIPGGPTPVTFAGTVATTGSDGRTALDTSFGRLLLDQRLALPPGTSVSLEPLATAPPGWSAAGIDMGMVVQAKVLSPGPRGALDPLPVGTTLMVRLAALPGAASAADIIGMIVAGGGGETVLDTPLGLLALDRRLALPAGTALGLQQLASTPPDQPSETPLAQRAGWPALDQALSILDRAAPELAARLRSELSPVSGQQLAGTLLFLMGALTVGAWPGAKATSALDSAGRGDLRARLAGDVAELRQLADPKSGDWRVFVLPMLDGATVSPVRLYLRRFAGHAAAPADQGTRFVLDVDMSRLGAVQLDGLVRNQRFDLVMRSHRPITADMRRDIGEVFQNSISAAGLSGEVVFTTASRFAVAPLDALRAHVGVSA
jgi:hypothetical protein